MLWQKHYFKQSEKAEVWSKQRNKKMPSWNKHEHNIKQIKQTENFYIACEFTTLNLHSKNYWNNFL